MNQNMIVETDRLGSSSLDPQDPRDTTRKRVEPVSPVMVDVIDLTAFEIDYECGLKKDNSFQSALQDSMVPQVGNSAKSRQLDKKELPTEVQVIRISSTEEREVIKVPSIDISEDGMEVKELISLRSDSQIEDSSWHEDDTQKLDDEAFTSQNVTKHVHEIITVNSDPPPKDYNVPPPKDYSVPPPKDYSVPSPKDYGVASPNDYSVASPKDYSVPPPKDYSIPSPKDYSIPSPKDYSIPPLEDYSVPSLKDYSKPSIKDYSKLAPKDYSVPAPNDYSVPPLEDYSVSSPKDYSVPPPKDYGVASPNDYSVASPNDYSVPSPNDYSVPSLDISFHKNSRESFREPEESEMRSQLLSLDSIQKIMSDKTSEIAVVDNQAEQQKTEIHDLTSIKSVPQIEDGCSVKTDQQAQDNDSLQFRSMLFSSQEKPPDEVDVLEMKSSMKSSVSNGIIQKSLTLPAKQSEKPVDLNIRNVLSDPKDPPESPGRSIYLRAMREGKRLADFPTSNARGERNHLSETGREGRRSFLLNLMSKAGRKYSQLAFHDLSHINKTESVAAESVAAEGVAAESVAAESVTADQTTSRDENKTKEIFKEDTVGNVNNVLHVIGTFEENQYGAAPREDVTILQVALKDDASIDDASNDDSLKEDSSKERTDDDDEVATTGAVYSGDENEAAKGSYHSVIRESELDERSVVKSFVSITDSVKHEQESAEISPHMRSQEDFLSTSIVNLICKTFSSDGNDTLGGGSHSDDATKNKPIRLFGGPDSRYRRRDPPERPYRKVKQTSESVKEDEAKNGASNEQANDSEERTPDQQDISNMYSSRSDALGTVEHPQIGNVGNEVLDIQKTEDLPTVGISAEKSINLVTAPSVLDSTNTEPSLKHASGQGQSLDRLADKKKDIMEEILSKVKRDNTFIGSDKDSDIEDALLPALKRELSRMRQIYSVSSRGQSQTGLVRTCMSDQTSDKRKSIRLDMQDFRETVMRRTGPDANVGITQSVLELINDDDDHLAEDKDADFDNLTFRYSHDLAVGDDDSMSSGTEDLVEYTEEDESVGTDESTERHEQLDEDESTQHDGRIGEQQVTSEQRRSAVVVENVEEDSEESGSYGANVSRDSQGREEWQEESNSDSKASIVDSISSESELDMYENSAFPYVVKMLDKSCAWLEGEDFMCGFQSRPSLLRKARKQVSNEKKYLIEKTRKKKSLPSRALRNPVLAKTINAKKQEPPGKRRILPSRRELIKDPKNENGGFDTVRVDGQQQPSMFVRPRRSRANSPKPQTPEEVKQEIKQVLSSLTPFQQRLRDRLDSIKIRDSVSEVDNLTDRGDSTTVSQEAVDHEFDIEQAQRDLKLAAMELEKFGELDVRNSHSTKPTEKHDELEEGGSVCVEPSDTRDEQESDGSQDENRRQGGNDSTDQEGSSYKARGRAGGPEIRLGSSRSWRRDPPISTKDNFRTVDPPEETAPPQQDFNSLNEEERLAALDLTEKLRRRAATLKRRRRLRERRMKHLRVLQTRSGSVSE